MFKLSRREGFLIEPYKQLRFGITFLLLNLVFSLLILLIFGYFVVDIFQAQMAIFQLNPDQSQEIVSKFSYPLFICAGLVALFVVTTLFTSARYTHQFYGPMVSIGRFLDEILKGKKPDPIQLRASDQLQDLASKLNHLIAWQGNQKANSVLQLENFLDEFLAGKQPKALSLGADDPLRDLAEKMQNALKR